MRCSQCGAEWPDTNKFCVTCGAALSPPAAEQPEETPAKQPVEAVEEAPVESPAEAPAAPICCPNCGLEWPAGSKFCIKCGASLTQGDATSAFAQPQYAAAAPAQPQFAPPLQYAPPQQMRGGKPPKAPKTPADKKKSNRLALIIAICAIVAAIAICGILFLPNMISYSNAEKLFAAQDYQGAKAIYAELAQEHNGEGYRDSVEKAELCQNNMDYIQASALLEQEDYEQAYGIFAALGDFSNSKALAAECSDNWHYLEGVAAMEKGDYDTAYAELDMVSSGFSDASDRKSICADYIALASMVSNLMLPGSIDTPLAELNAMVISDDPDVQTLIQALELIKAGGAGYAEAADVIYKHLAYHDAGADVCYLTLADWADVYNGIWARRTGDLDGLLGIQYGINLFEGASSVSLDNVKTLWSGSSNAAVERETVQDWLGADPQGKVLIYFDYDYYGTGEDSAHIKFPLMEMLPNELYPRAFDEVQYVINIEHSYSGDGSYTKGTKGIREYIKVTLVEYPSGKTLKTFGTVKGDHSPQTIYYYGSPPEYYSGGAPDMDDVYPLIVEALEYVTAME